MKKILLNLLRGTIIKKLCESHKGEQFSNDVLEALGLPQAGIPRMKNIPPMPKKLSQ